MSIGTEIEHELERLVDKELSSYYSYHGEVEATIRDRVHEEFAYWIVEEFKKSK